MTFSHPLARNAEIFAARSLDGDEKAVLAIVTTLELDPESKKYKKSFVARLSRAAQEYVADSGSVATAFVLMNRPKDWHTKRPKGEKRPNDGKD